MITSGGEAPTGGGGDTSELQQQVERLTAEVAQRDNEIQILIKHIESNKGGVPVERDEEVKTPAYSIGGEVLPGATEIGGTSTAPDTYEPSVKPLAERTDELMKMN